MAQCRTAAACRDDQSFSCIVVLGNIMETVFATRNADAVPWPQVMAVPTRDVPLRDARAGIEARLRDTMAQWGDSELSPAPKPEDEAALQSFLHSFEGANASAAPGGRSCVCFSLGPHAGRVLALLCAGYGCGC